MPEDSTPTAEDGDLSQKPESSLEDSSSAGEDANAEIAATTLVEILPGTAIVFGEVPEGLELVDFGLIPPADRERLSIALGTLGNVATAAGNVGNAYAAAQGLYRVSSATQALLNNGAQMAAKDGANIGAIFANGKIVAQARFVPYGITMAQAAASIGPAIAMLAIQMQLSEVSSLVETNIALTTQTLESIRREQWAELAGITKSIDRATSEAREIQSVTRLIWEDVAGFGKDLDKQLDLYRQNVSSHVSKLGSTQGAGRRRLLEANAEAIVFDTHALLYSLKAHTEYQALRAGRANAEGADRIDEAQLADIIARNAREDFESTLSTTGDLLVALTRELRIIAELPGRATVPLTKKRKDKKTARLTCAQLLATIEPLADSIRPPVPELKVPEVLCAPVGLDAEPYLQILRWFMEEGESLSALAFAYNHGDHDVLDASQVLLSRRVDSSWVGLRDGLVGKLPVQAISSTLVAVTDRRVMTAGARGLLRHGQLGRGFEFEDLRYVRSSVESKGAQRASIKVATRDDDVHWMFPVAADPASIAQMAAILAAKMSIPESEKSLVAPSHPALLQGSSRRPQNRDDGPCEHE